MWRQRRLAPVPAMASLAVFLLAAAAAALQASAGGHGQQGQGAERAARIIHGKPAPRGQFLYMAGIVGDNVYYASGSLISPTVVLTSGATCVVYKTFIIRLGSIHRTQSEGSLWRVQSIWAVVHPDYTPENGLHSIGVILLPQAAPLNSWIRPVALPSLNETSNMFVGDRAIVSGWGYHNDSTSFSDTLKYTEVTVIPNVLCKKFYNDTIDGVLCAGNEYAGYYIGDWGSPLVLKRKGGYKQIGIAYINVMNSSSQRIPGRYTRVTHYLTWLHTVAGTSPGP